MRWAALWKSSFALATLTWSVPGVAQDVSKTECAEAYEQAQERRLAGKLKVAREALVVCAHNDCPSFVQSDCARWLTEVEDEIPSIVIAARNPAGDDTIDVKISTNGELIAESLDGTAIDIDPGMHVVRFEHAGAKPIEKKILIHQGEKNRLIEVAFLASDTSEALAESPYGPKQASPRSDEAPSDPGQDESTEPAPLRTYAYVAGGVGAAGLVGFAVFGLLGSSEESELRDTCGRTRTCDEGAVDSARTKYLLADISLGIGVAGLGTGIALYFLSEPKADAARARRGPHVMLDVGPLPGGGFGTLSGRF